MTTNYKINQKNYVIKLVNEKSFILRVAGFSVSATLLLLLSLRKISISFVSIIQMLAISIINLKKITMVFSLVKLYGSLISVISLKKINLTMLIKEIGKIVTTFNSYLPISFLGKVTEKYSLSLGGGFLNLSLNPLIGSFILLSVYDPQALSDLDSLTLADMDIS